MTEIVLLTTKDRFTTKCDDVFIYNFLVEHGTALIPLINGDKLLLSKNEPILFREVE